MRTSASHAIRFQIRIRDQARNVARLYLEGRRLDQPATREQKELIENVVATDYDGRTVVELLQNAHDAHPRDRRDGQIQISLDSSEGAHGVLYIANGGRPFRDEDFESICQLALSSKPPAEGIGNKGLGFKSVLQLCVEPEIYSASSSASRAFDGYCFRFARPADFDVLAEEVEPDEPGLADELRENVSPLKVPTALEDTPGPVSSFAEAGFVTVVRLPLRSAEALRRTRDELDAILDSSVPFHLFLARVGSIRLEVDQQEWLLTRAAASLGEVDDLTTERVCLQDGSEFIILNAVVPEDEMRSAIESSRQEGRLGSTWERWEGNAMVSIALPVREPLAAGRLFTFLPMAASAPVPLRAFVNGPFFAHLNRRDLEVNVPLNSALFDVVARACATAIDLGPSGPLQLSGDHLVDLLTWSPAFRERLKDAFDALGVAAADQRCIGATGRRIAYTSLLDGWLWEDAWAILTPDRIDRVCRADIISPALHATRREALTALAAASRLELRPDHERIAEWAAFIARSLVAEGASADAWAEFFDDLAVIFKDATSAIVPREIIPTDDGDLVSADTNTALSVFFSPQADDDLTPLDILPPPNVKTPITFTRRDIPWNLQGTRRVHRPGRDWLEQNRLVRVYRTGSVLDAIGASMKEVDEPDSLVALLTFAFAVWAAGRDVADSVVEGADLRVPTRDGWRTARQAIFTPGWSADDEPVDRLTTRYVESTCELSDHVAKFAGRLLVDPASIESTVVANEEFGRFLKAAGVRHGLQPRWYRRDHLYLYGEQINKPSSLRRVSGLSVAPEHQERWLSTCSQRRTGRASYDTVEYRPTSGIAVIPGQFEYSSFDHDVRRTFGELVIHGLGYWSDSVLEFEWVRPTDPNRVRWPSIAGAFLGSAPWVPQTVPGDRSNIGYEAPRRSWWLAEHDTPDFLPAPPAPIRRVTNDTALARLEGLGVRIWDKASSSTNRVAELPQIVKDRGATLGNVAQLQIRKAYEEAWKEATGLSAFDAGTLPWKADAREILVRRAERLGVLSLDDESELVYFLDAEGAQEHRLLSQLPLPSLPFREAHVSEMVASALAPYARATFRPASHVEPEIRADGRPAAEVRSEPVVAPGSEWLIDLVVGVVEFRSPGIAPARPEQLRTAAAVLRQCSLAAAQRVTTVVDGHAAEVGEAGFAFPSGDGYTIIVPRRSGADGPALLEAAAPSIMEVLGFPGLGRDLKLALIELHKRVPQGEQPSPPDIAAVLGVSVTDLVAAQGQRELPSVTITKLAPIVACTNPQIAIELTDTADEIDTRESLLGWLESRLAGVRAEQLVELAEEGDLLTAIQSLECDLATANAAFKVIGHPPLHNRQGHVRQFTAYLQRNRSELLDLVRSAFVDRYRRRDDLSDYVALRDLSDVEPDPAWLDAYWDLPESVMRARFEDWLQEHNVLPRTTSVPPPVDEVRESNRRVISATLKQAKPVVAAWSSRNSPTPLPLPDFATVTEAMANAGLLDFEKFGSEIVIEWLATSGYWPDAMPRTLRLQAVGLTQEDVSDARRVLAREEDLARRAALTVNVDDQPFGLDSEGLREIADAVRAAVGQSPFPTSPEPLDLLEISSPPREASTSGGGGGSSSRRERVPRELTEAIGLAGEVAAGEWLQHWYGISIEDCWVSTYRDVILGGHRGDDALGYDFRVVLPDLTVYVEVKATKGTDTEFTLGESQVRRAQSLLPHEEFRILYVVHVLDSTRRWPHVLPNPFAPGGLASYRLAGQDLRLQFDLPDGV